LGNPHSQLEHPSDGDSFVLERDQGIVWQPELTSVRTSSPMIKTAFRVALADILGLLSEEDIFI
jgi:hypothetical protein